MLRYFGDVERVMMRSRSAGVAFREGSREGTHDEIEPTCLDVSEYLGEHTRGLLGAVRVDERAPRRVERWSEIADQLGGDLPHCLRLPRQLADVVAIVDRPLAEAHSRMLRQAAPRNRVNPRVQASRSPGRKEKLPVSEVPLKEPAERTGNLVAVEPIKKDHRSGRLAWKAYCLNPRPVKVVGRGVEVHAVNWNK
jgi:hypothetical protein